MPQTGATRYQKFLKSEKGKTKLKSKKELPKGTNVTKTNFKVKKIVIREQLKDHKEGEAITNKKLNLKDLLSRLNHFNVNSITEGLNGIKELISEHREILELNLGQLIHGITPLALHVERKVRVEAFLVINLILTKVPCERISPFYDVLSTYLRSAMTHIDARIQESSLLFLDFLLKSPAEKEVAADFYKILPNFIDMISKMRVDSKPGRQLTVNLGSNITSIGWRIKVLERLQQLLLLYVTLNKKTVASTAQKTHLFNENEAQVYPLYSKNFITNSKLPCLSAKSGQNENVEDEAENFKKYSNTLLPLLFETWLESYPNAQKKSENLETMLSEDAAYLLKYILGVMNLLWEYVEILNENNHTSEISKWFCIKFRKSYSQYIVNAFPFHTVIRSKIYNTGVIGHDIEDNNMINENLKVCKLYIALNAVNKEQSAETRKLLDYIEKVFSSSNDGANMNAVIQVLNYLFSVKSLGFAKNPAMDSLYEKIVNAYFENKNSRYHEDIFGLLCKISLDSNLGKFHKTDAHQKWIAHLPDILCEKKISVATIDIIHKFATQNNKVFNSTVKPKLASILDNLSSIEVTGAVNKDKEPTFKLFSLFYWINGWDGESLDLMHRKLQENAYGYEMSKFMVDVLTLKSQGVFKQ